MLNDPLQNGSTASPLVAGAAVFTPWYVVDGRDNVIFFVSGNATGLSLVVQGICKTTSPDTVPAAELYTLSTITAAGATILVNPFYALRVNFAGGTPGKLSMVARKS
jgi:hypothetical protein